MVERDDLLGLLARIALMLVIACCPARAEAGNVLTQHNNNARTGAALDETVLSAASVSGGHFGKLWTLYTDGQVTAQPLYVEGLSIDTAGNPNAPSVRGTFNTVIVATMHNTIYAYDADKEARDPGNRTVPLWATWLGVPRSGGKDLDWWSTNDPEWGILSTPVISDDKTTLYVVAWHNDGPAGLRYRLHALNLKNGAHRQEPVTIGKSSTDPSQPCKAQSVFNPCHHKQRTALLLSDGVLYIAFGGDGNRGALFAFDAQSLAQRAVWISTPNGDNGGLWQSGQGPAADGQGNIYLMIGNGSFDADSGGANYGSSFVKLRLEGQTLKVADYFTPCNFKFLNDLDLDIGSAGPLLVPGTPARIVSGGKEGVLYVLSAEQMGKFVASPTAPDCTNTNAVQQVNAFPAVEHNGQKHWGNIHGSPVFWKGPDSGRIYAWGENSRLKAYVFERGKLQDTDNPRMSAYRPPTGMPGGMLALSARDSQAGTGILWAVVPLDGDANQQRGVKGIVLALDAQDVSQVLWTSEQVSERDRLGLFATFVPPTVAGGKLFVATYGDNEPRRTYPPNPETRPTQFPQNYYVTVYGMRGAEPPPRTVVNQDRDDITVVRATTTPLTLDTRQCAPIDLASMDCTAALSQATEAPTLHHIVLAANADVSGCALLRVTTAAKRTGLDNATGIGFWSSEAAGGNLAAGDAGRFIPKADLKATGAATLKNGAPVILHEFVGVANCPVSGTLEVSRLFKPYMEFLGGADGKAFHNWDLASNYRISRTVSQFDRGANVLQ